MYHIDDFHNCVSQKASSDSELEFLKAELRAQLESLKAEQAEYEDKLHELTGTARETTAQEILAAIQAIPAGGSSTPTEATTNDIDGMMGEIFNSNGGNESLDQGQDPEQWQWEDGTYTVYSSRVPVDEDNDGYDDELDCPIYDTDPTTMEGINLDPTPAGEIAYCYYDSEKQLYAYVGIDMLSGIPILPDIPEIEIS